MADPASSNLLRRLHYLRNAAPREFGAFQAALNDWAGQKLALVTAVAPDNLPQFQGQMQGLEQVLTFLKESAAKPID